MISITNSKVCNEIFKCSNNFNLKKIRSEGKTNQYCYREMQCLQLYNFQSYYFLPKTRFTLYYLSDRPVDTDQLPSTTP